MQRHALGGRVDEEEVDVARRVAGAGQDHQRGRRGGEGDVALGPGQAEPVAVGLGPHLDAGGPAAVLGLEPRRGDDGLAPRRWAPATAPAAAAEPARARAPPHSTALGEMGRGGEGAAQLLVEHDALERAHARPAVLLGEQEPDQVELGQLLPQLGRVADGVVLELADHRQGAVTWRTPCAPSRAACPAPD